DKVGSAVSLAGGQQAHACGIATPTRLKSVRSLPDRSSSRWLARPCHTEGNIVGAMRRFGRGPEREERQDPVKPCRNGEAEGGRHDRGPPMGRPITLSRLPFAAVP